MSKNSEFRDTLHLKVQAARFLLERAIVFLKTYGFDSLMPYYPEEIMNKQIIITALIATSCCFANAVEWTISESSIILANDSGGTRAAAEELALHLKLVSGADILIGTNEISAPAGKFQFIVGRAAPDCKEQPKAGEARYAIYGSRAYLWGSDTRWFNGLFNAADFFLERQLNIKWIRPGAHGTILKEQKQVTLPEREDFAWELPYEKLLLRNGELWGESGRSADGA